MTRVFVVNCRRHGDGTSEEFVQNALQEKISLGLDDLFPGVDAQTFRDAGILTRDAGLVLTFPDGTEFQVTIVRSK